MKKELPVPLSIDCEGLSQKRIRKLAEQLSPCFGEVQVWGDEITASKPRSMHHYDVAWQIIDRYNIKAT